MSAKNCGSKAQTDRLAQALQHHKAGRLREARRLYERVLQSDSRCAEAMHLLGTLIGQQGDPAGALEWIDKALDREPDNPLFRKNAAVTLVQLGLALQHENRLTESAECYVKSIAFNPDQNTPYNNLGVIFDRAGDVEQAICHFRLALEKAPDHLPGLINLVAVLVRAKRYLEAEPFLRQLVERDPGNADAWNGLGLAAQERQHPDEAERHYLKAIEINPEHADALTNIGNIHFDKENYEEAEGFYHRAVALAPGCVEAWNGLRSLFVREGRDDEALQVTERILALKPDHPHGRFHLSWVLLSHASFGDGFRDYRWRPSRLATDAVPAGYRLTESLPSDLGGKRLLVFKDQGIGDEIFFLRFAPWLKARGAWVRYLATPKIASILSRCRALDEVVAGTTPDPSIDFAVNVGDLPALLGFSDIADMPPPLELTPLPERLDEMRARIALIGPPPYYAITWRAGLDKSRHVGRLVRSLTKVMSMDVIAARMPTKGTVLSVQRQPHEGETESLSQLLGRPVHDFSALNDDLESMLALLALVEDYYTVSNTNVHLFAGLGRTAQVFVPYPPEWRWLVAGDESPWFPGFRIVRQNADRSWPDIQRD